MLSSYNVERITDLKLLSLYIQASLYVNSVLAIASFGSIPRISKSFEKKK